MRILALNWRCLSHPQAGGSEVNLFEQARRWARAGHEVTVVCAGGGADAGSAVEEDPDGVVVRKTGGRLSIYPLVARFLQQHGNEYDVVLDVANGIPFFAPLFTSTPVTLLVHHVHGRQWYVEMPRPLAQLGWLLEQKVVPFLYQGRDVIAVSPTTRDALVETGLARRQISVVYNGTILPPLEDVATTQARQGMRVAYVGRLKRYKRVDRLLRAVSHLRGRFPNLRLEVAGDGDARSQVETMVEELGINNIVTLYGRVDEKQKNEILNRAAVFAMPSLHEGWGLSVIEANAYGVPAVAYDVPGLSAAIKDGVTGILAHDDAEFESALARLLDDDELRATYGLQARQWAAQFDWDAAAAKTLEVLQTCAKNGRPGFVRSPRSRSAA